MSSHPTLAFLGLGAMGARMARRLLAEGVPLVVWNRSPERAATLVAAGARLAPTPAAAAAMADVVISMVRDDDASEAVWLSAETGAVVGLRPGTLCLECSTLTPARIAGLRAAVRLAGGRLLDAPVVGTRPHADAGGLVFLLGGHADDVAAATPSLAPMAAKVLHVGPAGAGATLKLAVNSLLAIQSAAFAEVLGMLERAGIGAEAGMAALSPLPITSVALQRVGPRIAALDTTPNFPVELVEKDLGYVVAAAEMLGGRAPIAAAARAVFAEAARLGHAEADLTAVGHVHLP
jgi:3-hydroxyisobutyrate dehydrogenase